MVWRLKDQEFQAVRKLPSQKRFEYLLKRAADHGELWSLRSANGWVIGSDQMGREVHPVWPHPRYTEGFASGAWAGAEPAPIPVREWLDRWTAGMSTAGRLVSAFPATPDDDVATTPEEFADALRYELDQIE